MGNKHIQGCLIILAKNVSVGLVSVFFKERVSRGQSFFQEVLSCYQI